MFGSEAPSGRRVPEARYSAVLACFLLSGFAALLYQTAWLRQFSIVFGTSEIAVAAVLAAYMGGLALGAVAAGKLLGRVRRPVLVYGVLELGVAVGALLVPAGLALARSVHVALLGGQAQPPPAGGFGISALYLVAVFAVVALPTACMGATLPLLTKSVVRRSDQIGSRVGLLYTVNTAGAVLGTLATAFVLLPRLGLYGTVLVGAALNAAVFAIAATMARSDVDAGVAAGVHPDVQADPDAVPHACESEIAPKLGSEPSSETKTLGASAPLAPPMAQLILPAMLVSGATAFIYEVLWTRLLGHLLGASIFAFAVMLASFLTGITLGAALASRLAQSARQAALGFMAAQFGTAALSLLVYRLLDRLPQVASALAAGESASLAANALVASVVLLPATVCIGATFPFAVRVAARSEHDAGPAAASVLAWNTVGAITGAILAGFVIVPGLGFHGTIRLAVSINLLLAVVSLGLWARVPRWVPVAATAAAAAAVLMFHPAPPWSIMRASPFASLDGRGPIVFSSVGRSATVLLLEQDGNFNLRINGLPEATIAPPGVPPIGGRAGLWMSALPVLARPEARSMLVVGFGGGVALESVPSTIETLVAIELEPAVLEANRAIAGERRKDPFDDARLTPIVNDARSALALTTQRYDVIISQPSHPWTAGSSHLYTREFVRQVRDHLSPEGVFVQWISTALVDETLFKTLGATLLSEFQHVRLYRPVASDLLFLASDTPIEPERLLAEGTGVLAASRDVFDWLGVLGVEDLAARLVLEGEGVARICAGAEINTDDHNYLAMGSSPAVTRSLEAELEDELQPLDPLADPESALNRDLTLDHAYLAHVIALVDSPRRALRVARAASSETERALGVGLVLGVEGNAESRDAIRRALALDPENQDAGFAFVEPWLTELARGEAAPEIARAAERLTDPGAAVVLAWTHAMRGDWSAVAALDERLSRVRPTDVAFPLASQLRASWRGSLDHPDRRRLGLEALAIIDRSLAVNPLPRSLLVRAAVAIAADRPEVLVETANAVWFSIDSRAERIGAEQRPALARIAAQMLRHLETIAGDPRVAPERVEHVRRKLAVWAPE